MTETRGVEPSAVIRRLRGWTASSWRHADRAARVRAACQLLADLAAQRESRPTLAVPDHGESALADQLAVLVEDARRAGVPSAQISSMVEDLAAGLGLRS